METFNTLEKWLMATGFVSYIGCATDTIYHLTAPAHESHSYDIYLPLAVALGTISCMGSLLLSARRHRREVQRAKEGQLIKKLSG